MQITYFQQHQQEPVTPTDVAELLRENEGVLWVDIDSSNESELHFIKETFAPHPLTLEDLNHQEQRPKAEEFTDYLFVILNPIGSITDEMMFRELGLFIGKNYVITAHASAEPILHEVRKRLEPDRIVLTISPTYLLYVIFDVVLDGYLPALEAIEQLMENIGTQALEKPHPDILNQIFDLQRKINEFWWVAWPQQDIISVLTSHDMVFTEQKSLYYLRDISDHLIRIMNSLQMDRDLVNGLINLYMSSVSNQLNFSVHRLTLLTVGVGIFAVFSGFYGMNFERTWPPFNAPWGVPMVLLMMIATAFVAYRFLWHKKPDK